MLYLGDGSRRGATELAPHVISTVRTTIPGTQIWATAMALGPDGSLFTASDWQVSRFGPDGQWSRLAGGGSTAVTAAAVPATQVSFRYLADVAVGPDGLVYFPINGFIKRIRDDGIMETVAGVGQPCGAVSPEGTPTLSACLGGVAALAVAPDGAIYYLASGVNSAGDTVLRKVGTDGRVSSITSRADSSCFASGGWRSCCSSGDGGSAAKAHVCNGQSIALGPDGSIFVAQPQKVRRIGPDGVIGTFAGYGPPWDESQNGYAGFSGDGGPAVIALLNGATRVSAGRDGSVYIGDYGNQRIRRVAPTGIITTVAGNGTTPPANDPGGNPAGDVGDGKAATDVYLAGPYQALPTQEGELLITDAFHNRLRKVAVPLPGYSVSDTLIASRDGREVYVFDTSGRHLRTLDAVTNVAEYTFGYDSSGRLASITDRDGLVTRIERSGDAPTAIVSPYGSRTALTVDGNGYLNTLIDPAGDRHDFTYDRDGLMTAYTDVRRHMHTFGFDDGGRLVSDSNPAGGSLSLARSELADGYGVTVSTALGRVTRHDVQVTASGDRVLTTTAPDGTWTQRTERATGAISTARSDGTTSTVALSPDPRFRLEAPLAAAVVTTPAGLTRSASEAAVVSLQAPGDPLSLKTLTRQWTVNGRTGSSTYDAATRTVTTRTPAGRTTSAVLDSVGRLTQLSPPGALPVSYQYDAAGRLHAAAQGARTYTFDHDAFGRVSSVTDPASRSVSFTYDPANRVVTQTLPGARTVGFGYDAAGNVTSVAPPDRPAHGFSYTPVDLLESYTPPTVAGLGLDQTWYAYDRDGALTQLLLPDQTAIVPGYDAAGRVTSITTAQGTTVVDYDGAGRVGALTTPDGAVQTFGYDGFLPTGETRTGAVAGSVGWGYDSDFRLASVSVNGAAVSYQYDADSLLTQAGALVLTREPATGRLSGTTLGVVTTSQGYDGYGALASFGASVSGSSRYGYTLVPDAVGRIGTRTETVEGVTHRYDYGYDEAGRLWTVTVDGAVAATYRYDGNGNRIQKTSGAGTEVGIADDQDRLVSYSAATFTYRPGGALESRTVGGQTTWYGYDGQGNLRAAALPDGRRLEYLVDGLNRRVGKKMNGALVEGFLYEGQLRPVAWLDGSGAVKARFVYGTRENVPEYMVTASGTFRFITDHLGSPRLVVDSTSGAIAQRIDYDEWGQVLADSAPGFQPFGFAGGLYDRDTGLVRFGARDYDPSVGRWTNKDPLIFAGQDSNFYAYVWNDPVNFLDASGLKGTPAEVVYGETSGVYPLGGSIYKPSTWDPTSSQSLRDARSALAQFMRDNPDASVYSAHPGNKDKWGQKIYGMCKQAASTPSKTDLDDATNFWIGANEAPFGVFGPNTTSQDVVAKFGPFRNVGKGDAKGAQVYIWFYNVGTD